jgi:reactive intermediate/imine deaminase
MEKEIIDVPVISAAIRQLGVPLSPVTRGNGLVFVSGLPPLDLKTGELIRGDIEAQTAASLDAVKHALEAAGSSMEKVLKATVFIANAAYFPSVNKVYARYFPNQPPARTFVAVGSWPLEFDIEIECVALA